MGRRTPNRKGRNMQSETVAMSDTVDRVEADRAAADTPEGVRWVTITVPICEDVIVEGWTPRRQPVYVEFTQELTPFHFMVKEGVKRTRQLVRDNAGREIIAGSDGDPYKVFLGAIAGQLAEDMRE